MHEKVLETVKTVKTWLLRGLDDHSKICESCCHDNPHVHAEIIDQHIRTRICSGPRSVLVAPEYVASAAFTVCPLAWSFARQPPVAEYSSLDHNPWNPAKLILSSLYYMFLTLYYFNICWTRQRFVNMLRIIFYIAGWNSFYHVDEEGGVGERVRSTARIPCSHSSGWQIEEWWVGWVSGE